MSSVIVPIPHCMEGFFFQFIYYFFYSTILYWFCHKLAWICHGCTYVPHPEPPSPSHPSGSSQCTSPEHPVSCIEPELAICFTCDNLHVSVLFSHMIPLLPSLTESKDCSIHVCLFCCLTYRVIVTIFLNSIYMCVIILYWQRRRWHPTPVLLPGKSHGQRSLVGCSPWGLEELDTTERLHFSLSCIGEENGHLLQCFCLENPRDGGAWWAAVYGVTQSWSLLNQLSISSSSILYWCFSFWLTSLCIIGSSFIHLIRTDSNVFFLMAE